MNLPFFPHSSPGARQGAALVLIVVMMVGYVTLAAITVDYAYMQLVRSEMRAATDAAAKAGAEALSRTESIEEARAAAIAMAARNTVGGEPFRIAESNVVIGRVESDENNRWQFVADQSPPNAVRVQGRTDAGSLHGAIPLFFGAIHGKPTISPAANATAAQQEVEVCLSLDRSGSMLFDMSGTDFVYPPNNPNLMPNSQWNLIRNYFHSSTWNIWRNHLSPPHPTASRWAVLAGAIDLYLEEVGNYIQPPRTSLVTWASNYTMPVPPNTVFHAATIDVALPTEASWQANQTQIRNAVQGLGEQAMMGATNLSAGLDEAVAVLTGPNSKAFASKVVILMTDGQWNDGRNPIEAAIDARDAGITVHCIMFLTTDQADIRQVAEITGGRYYFTENEQQLRDAFQELARSLPIVLTE